MFQQNQQPYNPYSLYTQPPVQVSTVYQQQSTPGNAFRCKRCTKYYTPNDSSSCVYHPGSFRVGGKGRIIGLSYWSCCKDSEKSAVGCKSFSYHLEDENTTQILNQVENIQKSIQFHSQNNPRQNTLYFQNQDNNIYSNNGGTNFNQDLIDFSFSSQPSSSSSSSSLYPDLFSDNQNSQGSYSSSSANNENYLEMDMDIFSHDEPEIQKNDTESEKNEDIEFNQEKYFKHYIVKTDTFPGVALKYDITVDELKKINKFSFNEVIWVRKYVLIPDKGQKRPQEKKPELNLEKLNEQNKNLIVEAFLRIINNKALQKAQRVSESVNYISSSEANYYVLQTNYDLKEAIKLYENDVAWDCNSQNLKSKKIKKLPKIKKKDIKNQTRNQTRNQTLNQNINLIQF